LKPASVLTKQERIAELARENPAMAFTSLNHYLDAQWLECAFECTRKDGAVGVDGQTAESYAANLQQNLLSLIERLKSGRYRAPPVRRHYIPKAGGGERGLGIPAFEDKVAQRAITMLLEPIYEQTSRPRAKFRQESTAADSAARLCCFHGSIKARLARSTCDPAGKRSFCVRDAKLTTLIGIHEPDR
jgi:retron-type reverse transcriptase